MHAAVRTNIQPSALSLFLPPRAFSILRSPLSLCSLSRPPVPARRAPPYCSCSAFSFPARRGLLPRARPHYTRLASSAMLPIFHVGLHLASNCAARPGHRPRPCNGVGRRLPAQAPLRRPSAPWCSAQLACSAVAAARSPALGFLHRVVAPLPCFSSSTVPPLFSC